MSMATIQSILMGLLVLDAVTLGTLVLMQHGKGADVGAAFGSGGANTMFGSAGAASFLTKLTAWLAIGFFLISFGLAYTAKQRASELENVGVPQVSNLPQQPQAPGTPSQQTPAQQTPAPPAGSKPAPAQQGTGAKGDGLTPKPGGVDSHIPDV